MRKVDPVSGERYMYEDIYWYTHADLNLNAGYHLLIKPPACQEPVSCILSVCEK